MTTATRREPFDLTDEDMQRTDIPVNFWQARREMITAKIKDQDTRLIEALEHYLGNWDQVWERGVGLILSGPNGAGKTCAAVWVAKEFRRHHRNVLFMPAAHMFEYKINRTLSPHNPERTYWQWAQKASVLVIDDFGKGFDASGSTAIMWDELLRTRLGRRSVTIITTNLCLYGQAAEKGVGLNTVVKDSTWSVMKENMIPLEVRSGDRRNEMARPNLRLVQAHE